MIDINIQTYPFVLQVQDSPLRAVQMKIIHFLGSLGGQTNASLLETSADETAKEAVAWDTQPRLSFAVPFVDMKPNIDLGKMHVDCGRRGFKLKLWATYRYGSKKYCIELDSL